MDINNNGSTSVLEKKSKTRFFKEAPRFDHTLIRQNLAFLEEMLFGLITRGWLTDRDKELLDFLAPENCISFLIQGEKYLNPEDVALFPYELIEAAINQNDTAVFSHIFRPGDSDIARSYKIETAVVNSDNLEPVIFGLFGPEEILSHSSQMNEFHKMVSRFRWAYITAQKMIDKVNQSVDFGDPFLVVNRTSGRVIYTNGETLEICHSDSRSFIGKEYNEVKQMLPPSVFSRKIKLQNCQVEDFLVSIISFSSTPTEKNEHRNLTEFVSNKISDITGSLDTLSSEMINRTAFEESDKDFAKLNMHLSQLKAFTGHLQSIATHNFQNRHNGNLLYELDNAITSCSRAIDKNLPIRLNNAVSNLVFETYPSMLKYLFESILYSHLNHEFPMDMAIDIDRNNGEVWFMFKTTYKNTIDSSEENEWLKHSERLGAFIDIKISHEYNNETELTTTVII